MIGWQRHAKELLKVRRGHRAIIEAILHLGEMVATDQKPIPRFEVRDQVVMASGGAVTEAGGAKFKKGNVGTVTNPALRPGGVISVRLSDGCVWYVYENQLELVPDEPKQKFYEGDCARSKQMIAGSLTLGKLYLVGLITASGLLEIRSDAGFRERYLPNRFEFAAPGPNHPTE